MAENSNKESFKVKEALARIPHVCVRCGKLIEPGDIYYGEHSEKIEGLIDGNPKCYCQECYVRDVVGHHDKKSTVDDKIVPDLWDAS